MCRCGTAARSRCIRDRTCRNVVVVAVVTDVRRRVINAIRRWLKEFFYDFQESPRLLERVSAFIDSDVATCPDASIVKWVEPLKKIIAEQVSVLSSARSSGPIPHQISDGTVPTLLFRAQTEHSRARCCRPLAPSQPATAFAVARSRAATFMCVRRSRRPRRPPGSSGRTAPTPSSSRFHPPVHPRPMKTQHPAVRCSCGV